MDDSLQASLRRALFQLHGVLIHRLAGLHGLLANWALIDGSGAEEAKLEALIREDRDLLGMLRRVGEALAGPETPLAVEPELAKYLVAAVLSRATPAQAPPDSPAPLSTEAALALVTWLGTRASRSAGQGRTSWKGDPVGAVEFHSPGLPAPGPAWRKRWGKLVVSPLDEGRLRFLPGSYRILSRSRESEESGAPSPQERGNQL